MNVVVPLINEQARLALIHTGETSLKFRLFKSPFTVDELTQLSDLTAIEADFDSYTSGGVAPTWTTGSIEPGYIPYNETQLFNFVMPSPVVTPNTIYGWWIDDGTQIIMCGNLDSPVGLNNPGDTFSFVVKDSYPPGVPPVQVNP